MINSPKASGEGDYPRVAFKVLALEVDQCADELVRQHVNLLSPPTDQTWGHRTLFSRDPDGNLLEMFAEI